MIHNVGAVAFIWASVVACGVKAELKKNLAADELCEQAAGSALVDGFTVVEHQIAAFTSPFQADPNMLFNVRFKVKDCANVKTYRDNKSLAKPTIKRCIIDCDKTKNGGFDIYQCGKKGGKDLKVVTEIVASEEEVPGRAEFIPSTDKTSPKYGFTCYNWSPPSITKNAK